MPVLQSAAELPKGPEINSAKLPLPTISAPKLENAYQGIRSILQPSADGTPAKKQIIQLGEGLDETKKRELDQIITDEGEKKELLKLINEDIGDINLAGEKINQCETIYEQSGNQLKPEDLARKEGGLVEENGRFNGKFFRESPIQPGSFTEEHIDSHLKGAIQGIRLKAEEGNPEASQIYSDLQESYAVRVTYIEKENGEPQETTLTLSQWGEKVGKKSADLWTAKHGGEMSFADLQDKFPEIANAYRLKAEQEIDPQAKFSLHALGEKPPEESQPEKSENLTAKEYIYDRTKNTLHDIVALADDIDVTDPEALREVFSPVQQVVWLEYLFEGYNTLKSRVVGTTPETQMAHAKNERMLAGFLMSHFNEMSKPDFISSLPDNEMGKTLQSLLLKIKNEFKDRDLSEIEKGLGEFDTEILLPVLKSVSREPESLYGDIRRGMLSRVGVVVLGARFHEASKTKFFDFDNTYNQFAEETGIQLTDGEKTFVRALGIKEIFTEINGRMQNIGLDLTEIGDSQTWLNNHNESVVKSTMSEDELKLDDETQKKLIANRMAANKIIHEIPDIDALRNLNLKNKIVMMLMLASMFSGHIQKGLEEGTETAEPQRPG